MKSNVLKMERSLDDAVVQALIAIESGQFQKVIKLLEYVKENKVSFDEVMIEYALLISYVNSGNNVKASESLKTLDTLYIENEQIKDVIQTIKNEVFNNQKNEEKIVKKKSFNTLRVIKDLGLERSRVELYRDLHVDDYMWSLILAAIDNLGDSRNEFEHEYKLAKKEFSDIYSQLVQFDEFSDSVTPLDLFEGINANDSNVLFWMLMDKKNIIEINDNKNLPEFIRKYVVERAVHFCHYGLIEEFQIEFENKLQSIGNLPDFSTKFYEVSNNVESYYSIEKSDLYDMITSVLNIIYIDSFPNNIYNDKNKLEAMVGYIVNDIFIGRKYDKLIEKKTKLKFDDVKQEIKQLEMLITFLIS